MNMTHEMRDLVNQARLWQDQGLQTVLATVVALEGSSYRRPGVRMLINERGQMSGAVSGGCVEKEVLRQAQSVLSDGIPKMMTYDGLFRLGCAGMIHLLIEPIQFTKEFLEDFETSLNQRQNVDCRVHFHQNAEDEARRSKMGSIVRCNGQTHSFRPDFSAEEEGTLPVFAQTFPPIFQLFIFGSEHDAVQLSKIAAQLGWDVHIIAPPEEEKSLAFFAGAKSLSTPVPNAIDTTRIDENSAVMLMSHSLSKDVQYLLALHAARPAYLGLLGPDHRRERIFDELFNLHPELQFDFLDQVRGPAGLHIGAESAAEIAVSIVAEILAVIRDVQPQPLHEKSGKIHG